MTVGFQKNKNGNEKERDMSTCLSYGEKESEARQDSQAHLLHRHFAWLTEWVSNLQKACNHTVCSKKATNPITGIGSTAADTQGIAFQLLSWLSEA